MVTKADELVAQGLLVRHDPESVRLERMYVRPPFRRRGIATSLVGQLMGLASELRYKGVVLDVMATRNEAIRLYERLGFRAVEPYATSHVPMRFMGLDFPTTDPEARSD